MPKLKQPATLQSIVMDSLVEFVMQFLDNLNDNGSSEDFRQGISVIKDDVRDRMPALILVAFITAYEKQLTRRLYDERWKSSNYKTALLMLMDVEIIGLKCDEEILAYVDPQDMHRFQVLTELDLSYVDDPVIHRFIETCDVNGLTTFTFSGGCTDDVLRLITDKCSNLRVLKIPRSNITDNGLRALIPCKNLRVIDISNCKGVSHPGLSHLLSSHDGLEELSYSYRCASSDNAFDFLSCLEKPCLSIKCFRFQTNVVSDANLRSTVAMFPNLTNFELTCERIGDLAILRSLSKLREIGVRFFDRIQPPTLESAWRGLRELLTFIGPKITTLEFSFYRRTCVTDEQALHFIYEHCPNIECLKFDYVSQDLVVPPFRQLRVLCLFAHTDEISFQLDKFEPLLNLEVLHLIYYKVNLETVKLMMLDEKFPKLAGFATSCRWDDEAINRIASENNLDFKLYTHRSFPGILD